MEREKDKMKIARDSKVKRKTKDRRGEKGT